MHSNIQKKKEFKTNWFQKTIQTSDTNCHFFKSPTMFCTRSKSWKKTNTSALNVDWFNQQQYKVDKMFLWKWLPTGYHAHDFVFIGLSLVCDDCIFMCVLVCNLAVDYITLLWFFNYPSDRPGSGNDLWKLGSAFWLCWPSVTSLTLGVCQSQPVFTHNSNKWGSAPCMRYCGSCWQDQGYLWALSQLRHGNTRRLHWWKSITKQFLCHQPDMDDVEVLPLERKADFLKAIGLFLFHHASSMLTCNLCATENNSNEVVPLWVYPSPPIPMLLICR